MSPFDRFADRVIARARSRPPDYIVGGLARPYMLRWWVVKRRALAIYVHQFLRSDDDRALHDHVSGSVSFLLDNEYTEHTIAQGGIHRHRVYRAGDIVFRPFGGMAHRIELHNGPAWSLWIRGPIYRQWGFHCAERGWVHWRQFTAPDDTGVVGKGCEA